MYEDISALRALERLREEWTSVVTHELRQPLATIHGYAGVLARELKDQERAWAKHIQASARRLDRMISDLHEASQIDARRLALELTPTDLAALVAAAVERAGAEAEGRPIRVDIRGEIPVTEVDPARIEQVLGNLLSNAVKYGDPGTSIRVGVARRDAEVEVEVESRGPGIAAEDLPRLFGRFQRARPPGGKRVPGTGLGLYICRGIVEAHGGRIWAESVPGGVTTFRFTLPVR
jgi:signal transduction histidine kinase